jgi:hypothetical protein
MKARVMIECDGRAGMLRPVRTTRSVDDGVIMDEEYLKNEMKALVVAGKEEVLGLRSSCSLSFSRHPEREEGEGKNQGAS